MPNIKPVSELRNYTNVVNQVKYGEPVYLTKNGHGEIAMVSMEEYDEMKRQIALYKFYSEMAKGEQSIQDKGAISHEDLMKELGL